jgi:hypothetical protein
MDKMLRTSPEYFTTIVNQLESVVLKYNYGILQLLDEKREAFSNKPYIKII